MHTLSTACAAAAAPRTVSLKLATVPCQTLFTAQRWRTTAGAGLRLRIDSRTALARLSFGVPAALLPRRAPSAASSASSASTSAGRPSRCATRSALPRGAAHAGDAARRQGRPTVTLRSGGLRVAGLPLRTAVAEVTLYRVTKLDHATSPRAYTVSARITREGAAAAETLAAKPKAPR